MKSFVMIAIALSSTLAIADYLPENKVREICLRNFARTMTCSAQLNGKNLSIDMDKESLKAYTTNYFEYGIAVNGFFKKTGLFGSFPQWRVSCDPDTGALQGAKYIKERRLGKEFGVSAKCR